MSVTSLIFPQRYCQSLSSLPHLINLTFSPRMRRCSEGRILLGDEVVPLPKACHRQLFASTKTTSLNSTSPPPISFSRRHHATEHSLGPSTEGQSGKSQLTSGWRCIRLLSSARSNEISNPVFRDEADERPQPIRIVGLLKDSVIGRLMGHAGSLHYPPPVPSYLNSWVRVICDSGTNGTIFPLFLANTKPSACSSCVQSVSWPTINCNICAAFNYVKSPERLNIFG